MAAVQFSIVAVLCTIRLCVDDRCRLFSGPMLQLLRHACWHRSGSPAVVGACKGDRRKLWARAKKLRDVTLDLCHRLQSRTRKKLLGTSADQDDEKQLLLSSPSHEGRIAALRLLLPFPQAESRDIDRDARIFTRPTPRLVWSGAASVGSAPFFCRKKSTKITE